MPIDIRALRYFVETVQLGSFTQAAAAVFVTQSTISKMVRQLEDEVGQPLLIRDGRQVQVTDVGRIVYERGLQALSVIRELQLEVADVAQLGRGQLTVGMPPMGNLFFPAAVRAFQQRYPKLELRLAEHGGQLLEQKVIAGELEVGATVLLPGSTQEKLASRVIARYTIWAVGPREAPWAGRRTVRLAALKDQPLILLDDGFALTRRLHAAFRDAGIEPTVVARSGHWDFLAAMAGAGLGTTFLPEPFLARLDASNLALARVTEPSLDWTLMHIWSPDRYMSHAAHAWLAICDEVLGKQARVGTL
ncbi:MULTISPECIES: LysR family transcriptional regulator [unclassified Paraburkholderia]|uniref:LysR family transcriptional regulator n=1 Tax=unclassified Paraburkholderia TaxID=2615204 RepID=UPI002AB7CC15|nr:MULTISPECIES: LysR family transcriptional regulator [unclassified Paraburkholderia]